MTRTKKIISLMMAVLLVVSLVPAMSATAVEISKTFDVTLDASSLTDGKDPNFDLWKTTVTEKVIDEVTTNEAITDKDTESAISTSGTNIVLPTSTYSWVGLSPFALSKEQDYKFLKLNDNARKDRVVDSVSFTVSGASALGRGGGITVGLYENNGYIVGVQFNGVQQLAPMLFTGTHYFLLDNSAAGNVLGYKVDFYAEQYEGTKTSNINAKMEMTYTFQYVYSDDGKEVTKINWFFTAKPTDASITTFYTRTSTAAGTECTGTCTKNGSFTVNTIKTSAKWLANPKVTEEIGGIAPASMKWDKTTCSPVIVSGVNTGYSTIKSVTYTLQKTQAELDKEAADQVPAAVTAAYTAFEADKSKANADAFLKVYKQLPSNRVEEFAEQYATVTAWINQQYVSNGTFTYKTAEVAAYPNVQEYLEGNDFGNAFDNGMVQSATAVFDKEALKTAVSGKDSTNAPMLLWLNKTDANRLGNGQAATIAGFGLRVVNQADRDSRQTLLLYNTIGDAKTLNNSVEWEIAKTGNSYGKLDWYTQYQVTEDKNYFDYADANKMTQVEACANAKYLALSYTVNYEDVADKSYTQMYFQIKFWVDNGDGIYEDGEVILTEETKTSRTDALLYNYKDGRPRTFEFGGIDDAAKTALVSLTLKNDFVADYSAVYGTTPKADTVKLEEIVAMKADLDAVYPAFVSDTIRQQANAAYASILPIGNGATVRTDINQNLAFYGVRPAFFTGCENNATYQANLASAKSFGAVFQSYNTMVADENHKELTTDNHGGNIVKSYTDGGTIADDAELLFTLSNIDVKNTDKWGYWIVARFYVTYEIDGNLVTLYSEGASDKPATAGGLTEAQASGTTIRSVNGILSKMYTAVKANKETYATYTGATVEKYKDQTLTEGLEIYKAAYNSAASAADKSLELCNFLIAYKGVVDAIVNARQ